MKKFLKGALASAMALSLAACGNNAGQNEGGENEGIALPEEGTTVTIWHTFTNDQLTTLEAIANEFNATNEYGITVKVESQAYDGFLDTVKSNVYNGTGPDMILNYASAAADYIEDEKVLDFAPLINDPVIGIEGYAESKPAGIYAEETGFEDGGHHVIVTQTTGPIVFYNKTFYDQLGLKPAKTWAELEVNSQKVHDEMGIAGFAFDSLTDSIQALIMQNEAGYIDVENREVLWNNDKTVELVDYIARNTQNGNFLVDATNGYFSSDINSGLVAAYVGSVAGLPYVDLTPNGWELACAPMPMDGNGWNPAWDRGLMVFDYEDDNRTVASYLFIKYFIETENSKKWNMAMNSLSPFFAVQEDAEYQEYVNSNIALAALAEQIPTSGVLTTISGSATVRTELESAVRTAAAGTATAKDALAEAAANSNAALKGE